MTQLLVLQGIAWPFSTVPDQPLTAASSTGQPKTPPFQDQCPNPKSISLLNVVSDTTACIAVVAPSILDCEGSVDFKKFPSKSKTWPKPLFQFADNNLLLVMSIPNPHGKPNWMSEAVDFPQPNLPISQL